MHLARRATFALGALLVLAGLVLGAQRVFGHEREELERVALTELTPTREADGTLAPHREIVRAELREGEDVVFEVCAEDPLDADIWADRLELIVWQPAEQEVIVRAPLDRARLGRARRSPRGSCIHLAHGESIPIGGDYAIEAVWAPDPELPAAIRETPLAGRILAHRPLHSGDVWPVWLLLAGAFATVLGLAVPRAVATSVLGAPRESRGLALALAALAALVVVIVGLGLVALGGATIALGRGIAIAIAEIALAFAFVGAASRVSVPVPDSVPVPVPVPVPDPVPASTLAPRRARLGLVLAKWWVFPLAPVAGVALWVAGGLALQLVPSTGEAPVETLVAWPSGSLALALVAVVVPIAEEIFFRGLVFGLFERRFGGAIAALASLLLFALAHLPQDWGAWGALVSILVAGTGFTAIRWATGSTVAAILAHLTHNALVVLFTLGAG